MRGKWPSFDYLDQEQPVGFEFAPFADEDTYPNPFQPIEVHGAEWAAQGMDPEAIVAAAIALGGLPKPRGAQGDTNLQHYAENIHELHAPQAGGEQ
jgi:hypothetical protein